MSQLTRPVTAPRWPAGRRRVAMRDLRLLTWAPVGALAVLLLCSVVTPASVRGAALPLAVAGAAVGLPHGAVDHLVPWWWGRRGAGTARGRGPLMAAFAMGYAAVAGFGLAAFLVAPAAALTAFLVLSAVHFGRAEVVAAAERADRPPPSPGDEWLGTAAHGAAVVGLLLWASPGTTALLRPLSPQVAGAAAASRVAGLVFIGALVLASTADLLRRGDRREAAELALVAVTFAVAPPLAAFGVYFAGWHALRHTGRLLDLAGPEAGWTPAAARLARASAMPTVAALGAIAALWWTRDLAGLHAQVVVLLALTLPHAAVVWAMDRRAALAARGG